MRRSSRCSTSPCAISRRSGPCPSATGNRHSIALPWSLPTGSPNDQKATYTKGLTDSNLDNPEYIPVYKTKRDLLEFFGITVIAWGLNHNPPYKAITDPPSLVSHQSKMASP